MSNDRDFLAAFENGTLPEERFHHADHVRAAWLILGEDPPAAALGRFSAALKRFAAAKNRRGLYHETITWAYLLLVNERMERAGRDLSWEEFAASNPDLMTWRPSVLDCYYTPETLSSDLARRAFVLPDRNAEIQA
ncbi:MAG: hypothetical protein M3547_06320 [Acidobacteriota bacterium]|nr:hypothetical protein [Acidobacteriota bacterium]